MLATPPLIGAPVSCWDCGAVLCGVVTDSGYVACQACGAVTGRRAQHADRDVRCWRCRKLIARLVSRPWAFECGRCKATNQSAA